ncbi:ABC-type multidrug transport system ATPase subunit [Streptomyces sp. PvR006]|uniref:ATP-binding cassette domain-containing protein n=1 Tax=unclassified Streptomyces TaxID=2593676 RepID=UPI001AE3DF8E|nr:ATP-binding cassette domain-containing protein [Streptomyces sp. PvR006]MBP2584664.1 ABC-type multidrug transport system ATPase subunit [Streptomyces sp. PvR006]
MALIFQGLTFRYGRKADVFSDFSGHIEGPSTVLLGPNGAGKSTLMALAASHLVPRSGTVTWNGTASSSRRERATYRRAVAWIPQQITPIPGLTVREQVAYAGWLKGLSRTVAWENSANAIARVRLEKLADRKSHQLSGGQLRRMGIAGALTHQSEIVLMDEPTAGLDPTQRRVFRDLVTQLSQSVSVVVSTHQTEDLADLYQDVIVLAAGRTMFQGSTQEFHALAGQVRSPRENAEAAYATLVGREV